jgi:hypothetical protein
MKFVILAVVFWIRVTDFDQALDSVVEMSIWVLVYEFISPQSPYRIYGTESNSTNNFLRFYIV